MGLTPGRRVVSPLQRRREEPAAKQSPRAPQRGSVNLTPASAETIAARLAICLGPPERCYYAHDDARGVARCKQRCCGPLARSLAEGVSLARVACPLRVPKWGPESRAPDHMSSQESLS